MFGDALEDFVHSFGAEGGFGHVGDGDGSYEGGEAGIFTLVVFFWVLVLVLFGWLFDDDVGYAMFGQKSHTGR